MTTSVNSSSSSAAGLEAKEDDNRLLKIKKLKAKLINEEHRLVLMKKIRQSQTRPIPATPIDNSNSNSNSNNNINNINSTSSNNISNNNNNLHSGQMKKLRPPQLAGPLSLQKNNSTGSPPMNQTPAHAHQRPKVSNLWNPPQQARHPTPIGIAPPHVGNLSRQPITTPPNVVQAMMGATGQPTLSINPHRNSPANSSIRNRTQQQPSTQLQQQAAAFSKTTQQQAAAQLAGAQKRTNSLKTSIKQLEQTILQQQHQGQKIGVQPSVLGFSPNVNKRSGSLGVNSPHVGNLSRQPITTPPNVVQDLRGGLAGQQSLLMNTSNNSLSAAVTSAGSRRLQPSTPQQSSSFNKSQAAQMLLQKRTAAKAAIQKQLEQTLMQLPQKHVQLGLDFIPNANNMEFVYFVGLEACVDYLTNTKSPLDTQPLEKPFECSTCGTDFTPSWSWKRSNAVCENCVSNHVRKSIKNSQAGRIKAVLVKAAKQEQDVEQRIMNEAATVVSSPSSVNQSPQIHHQSHHTPSPQQHQHQQQQRHSLLQPASHQQRTSQPQQMWPRLNASPLTSGSSNRQQNVQTPAINTNPLAAAAGLQPAALASLLQMNPQLSTLASLMTANNNTNNNTNQFAQVAALLMNQLTMNLWKR